MKYLPKNQICRKRTRKSENWKFLSIFKKKTLWLGNCWWYAFARLHMVCKQTAITTQLLVYITHFHLLDFSVFFRIFQFQQARRRHQDSNPGPEGQVYDGDLVAQLHPQFISFSFLHVPTSPRILFLVTPWCRTFDKTCCFQANSSEGIYPKMITFFLVFF